MTDTIEEEPGLCLDNFQWDDDVRYRFECTENGSFKFYEITVTELNEDPCRWRVTNKYGRMDRSGGQTRVQHFNNKWDADLYVRECIGNRLKHGYKEVKV